MPKNITFRISDRSEETDCDYCGAPLHVGETAQETSDQRNVFCSDRCAELTTSLPSNMNRVEVSGTPPAFIPNKRAIEKRNRKAVDCYICGQPTLSEPHMTERDGHVRHASFIRECSFVEVK